MQVLLKISSWHKATHWRPEAVLPCSQWHQDVTGQVTWNYSSVRKTLLKQRWCQMTVGSHTQLWSFVPVCTGNSCSGIHGEGTRNTAVLETANTHTLVVSKSTHIIAVLFYEPLAALKSVALGVFCCSNLKNMYFITVLRLHVWFYRALCKLA